MSPEKLLLIYGKILYLLHNSILWFTNWNLHPVHFNCLSFIRSSFPTSFGANFIQINNVILIKHVRNTFIFKLLNIKYLCFPMGNILAL